MRRAVLAILALAFSGCFQAEPSASDEPVGPAVEGWVVDLAYKPIVGANVSLTGTGLWATTDDEGHFGLEAPPATQLLVTVTAPGFMAASQSVGAASGSRHILNFTLERVPAAAPYTLVESFNGFLQCGVTLVVMENQSTPHEHQGARCSTLINDTRNTWHTAIPNNATGMIIETEWTPNSEFAQGLVMKIVVDGSGDVLGFIEGRSILRVQLSQAKLLQNIQAGFTDYTVTIEAGAGTGEHEHGAVGVFYEQAFTIYATTFYNGPADPSYSIADRD